MFRIKITGKSTEISEGSAERYVVRAQESGGASDSVSGLMVMSTTDKGIYDEFILGREYSINWSLIYDDQGDWSTLHEVLKNKALSE